MVEPTRKKYTLSPKTPCTVVKYTTIDGCFILWRGMNLLT